MNYNQAMQALVEGKKVRLPEWQGYWFKSDSKLLVMTKDGEVLDTPWKGPVVESRTDWELAEGLDFGWAINALKNGKLVSRRGWNGKGMFIFMHPAEDLPVNMVINFVKSLPQTFKSWAYSWSGGRTHYTGGNEEIKIKFLPYLCMKTVDHTVVNGWLASQSDMLAEDWELFQN